MKDTFSSPPQLDSRSEQRYRVYWRANLHLPGARTIDARLSDISGDGVGLLAGEAIAVGTLMPITMGVPAPDGGAQLMAVQCNVRIVNLVLSGRDYRMGALWVDPPASVKQIIESWIRKLRYTSAVIGSS